MASKQNYIATRIAEQHNVDEYPIKTLPLDLVMTAFMAEKVLAANPANHVDVIGKDLRNVVDDLIDGKAVMINSEPDCELYYVVAHDKDLVAAFYPVGPWQEIYAAISSMPSLLEDFGITTPSFMDKTLIDKLFRFPAKVKKVKADPAVAAGAPVVDYPSWAWHRPVAVKQDEEEEVASVVVTPTVVISPSPDTESAHEAKIIDRKLDSQMGQAFDRAQAGQGGGSRAHRNQRQERRASETINT